MPNDSGLKLLVNPRDMEAQIGVDFLVRCFGESWNSTTYQWYLRRVFHGEAPDQLVLVDGRRVLAMAGIAYRQLRTPDGSIHRVGIMIAACVAPQERGRFRFSRLTREAVGHCATRGCCGLLGFVTADNATCVHMRRVGAAQIPSAYISSDDSDPEPAAAALDVAEVARDEWRDYAYRVLQLQLSATVAGFLYPDVDAWWSQLVERPHPVELLRVGDTCRAIVERVNDTDRLQWLDGDPQERGAAIAAVVARARRMRRRFFMYSTPTLPTSVLQACGLKARPGFMMVLAAQPEHEPLVQSWPALPWRIHSGDRL
jgi:hypothetical protein